MKCRVLFLFLFQEAFQHTRIFSSLIGNRFQHTERCYCFIQGFSTFRARGMNFQMEYIRFSKYSCKEGLAVKDDLWPHGLPVPLRRIFVVPPSAEILKPVVYGNPVPQVRNYSKS